MFLTRRFYIAIIAIALLTGGGYLLAPLYTIGRWLFVALITLVGIDLGMLYLRRGMAATRQCSDRFSNGDDNEVALRVESNYSFATHIDVIDEIPFVFQRRDILFTTNLKAREGKTIRYHLRPTERGVYTFGHMLVFASTILGLVQRRYRLAAPQDVKVYPSYLMLHQYELLAISNRLTDLGIKRIRRIGHHTEFEQIKDYVQGDDYRTINWKASARQNRLMVNVYQDERSQHIYSVIDKGRVMQQSFRGMTLLDYAINASLVLAHVAMVKDDKAGLATFDQDFDTFVPAAKQSGHMQTILEALYSQHTRFGESDYSALYSHLTRHIGKRSLLIVYTNFTGIIAMKRQLPNLIRINQRHRLLVVFFEDAEIKDYIATPSANTEDYYRHVIAEKFTYEQHLIVSTLKQNGIYSLLTTPENLSIDVINKYLEMKSTSAI